MLNTYVKKYLKQTQIIIRYFHKNVLFTCSSLVAGKILENLTLGPARQEQATPPSQPPTPPSTPLSPPNSAEAQKHVPTTLPQLPNISITRAVSPIQRPQQGPLDLGAKKKKPSTALYTNGISMGLNLSASAQTPNCTSQNEENGTFGIAELEAIRSKMADLTKMASMQGQAPRVSVFVFFLRTTSINCHYQRWSTKKEIIQKVGYNQTNQSIVS